MTTANSKNGRANRGSSSFFRKVGALLSSAALLVSTNLTTAALANEQGGRHAAFNQFQLDNPGLSHKELHQMFKQQWNSTNVQNNLRGFVSPVMRAQEASLEMSAVTGAANFNATNSSDLATLQAGNASSGSITINSGNALQLNTINSADFRSAGGVVNLDSVTTNAAGGNTAFSANGSSISISSPPLGNITVAGGTTTAISNTLPNLGIGSVGKEPKTPKVHEPKIREPKVDIPKINEPKIREVKFHEPKAPKSAVQSFNQSVQQVDAAKYINVNQGFALDLNSAVESITLGDKLFKDQSSVTINVGGEEKTFTAGSKVTAAEYVAAKQAMSGGQQTVTLDSSGRAIAGVVDLSAMTAGNKTMKVTDLNVPVSVTAAGDFGKGGDVRITGDLTNSGSITAYSSGNSNVQALIKADNITNNAGASIGSTVSSLTLQADNSLTNFGDITASGDLNLVAGNSVTNSGTVTVQKNLAILSPNVTNSGSMSSSQGNISFGTSVPAALNVNNAGGTISALNGAINIREAGYAESFNTTVNGGNLFSKELNVNTGSGISDVFVNQLTGVVNTSGLGAHISADTDVLTIGTQCLVGDPTYFNTGNIVLDGNIFVGEAVSIIAGGSILATSNLTQILARNAAGQGFDINLVAGANITAGTGPVVGNLPAQSSIPPNITNNATSPVTIDGPSAAGGNVDLSGAGAGLSIRSSSTTNGFNGGDIQIVAYRNNNSGGSIVLPADSIVASNGGVSGLNGDIRIFGGQSISVGTVSTSNFANQGGGLMTIANTNAIFSSGTTMTFDVNGQVVSGNEFTIDADPATWGAGNVTVGPISSLGFGASNLIQSGHSLTVTSIATTTPTTLVAGRANSGSGDLLITGNADAALGLTANASGSVTAQNINSANGNIQIGAGTNVSIANATALTTGDIIISAGGDITTANLTANGGSVSANALGNVTVANVLAGTAITIGAGPLQFPAVNGHIVTGNLTASEISLLAPYGDVTINGTLNVTNMFTLSILGDITQAFFGGSVFSTSQSISLNSTIGSIGSALNPLLVSTPEITANAALGSVYVSDVLSAAQVTVAGASGDVVQIVRANPGVSGGILVTGHIGANTVILTNSGANGEVDITSTGSIGGLGGGSANSIILEGKGIGRVRSDVNALLDTLSLTASTGSGDIIIGDTTARSITASTDNNVLITDSSTSTVTLNAIDGRIVDIELTTPGIGLIVADSIHATESLRLTTDDTLSTATITRTGAGTTLVSPEVRLVSGGQIGTSTAAILTDTDLLSAVTGPLGPSSPNHNIFISDAGSVAVDFIVGNIVNLSAVGSITNNTTLTEFRATTLNMSSTLGSIGELGVGTNGRIFTTASSISATANGDVYLATIAPLVQFGVLSGQIVDVDSTDSRFNLLENITGTTSVSIHTQFNNPLNSITQVSGKTIFTPILSLSTTGGNIGTASNQIRTTAGLIDANSTGNVFLNATGEVSMNASSGDTFRLTSGGGITVLDNLLSNNLTLTSGNNGNIDLQAFVAGLGSTTANNVILNANGSGNITQLLGTTVRSNSLSLNSGSGNIGDNTSPIQIDNAVPTVNLSVHTNGDWFVSTAGNVNLGASTGRGGTLVASNVTTTGNTTLTGTLDISTLSLDVAGDKLTADIINVRNLPGGFDLTINGGVAGGIFQSATQTNWVATNGGDINLNGKVTMIGTTNITTDATAAVNINSGANYTGQNQVTITTGTVFQLGNISGNPLIYNVLGNTIVNSQGDVNLSSNIIFLGQDFAILASGNVNMSSGTTIRLDNPSGDGGDLLIVAGYNISPSTGGQIKSGIPYTLGTASLSGGSVNLSGVSIDLSGTGSGGSLTVVAQGQPGASHNAGTVSIGSVTTTGISGGNVNIIGSGGVNVGTITTTGSSVSGDVSLSVLNTQIVGGQVIVTNGTRSGSGQFVSNGLSSGLLSFTDIAAQGADVFLTGASAGPLDTITGSGTIVADSLTLQTGTGTAQIGLTRVNTLNSNGDGIVSLSNTGAINLGSVSGAAQELTITSTSSITDIGGFNVRNINLTATAAPGSGAIVLNGSTATNSATLTTTSGDVYGDISTPTLVINAVGKVGLDASTRFSTDAASITITAPNAFINSTNATGTTFSGTTVPGVFNLLATGIVQGALDTSTLVVSAGGIGTGSGANALQVNNGGAAMSVETHTGAGNAFVRYNGSAAVTIAGGSDGNNYSLETLSSGNIVTGGNSTFTGDVSLTSNSVTNANTLASSGGDIFIQSLLGSGLTLNGGAGGNLSAAGNILVTARANALTLQGLTTYLTTATLVASDIGQSIIVANGSNSVATVASFLSTSNVDFQGGLLTTFNVPGATWTFSNPSGTYANLNGAGAGNVTLTGTLTLAGANIAIIAGNNIDLTGLTLIDLSSGASGGSLTMLAGYAFSPTTGGVQVIDTSTNFNNFTPSALGGSILGAANINLSGGVGSGGNLLAVASNGNINLGTVTTSGGTTGGSVKLIATGNITVDDITTVGGTPAQSGAVTIAVATPLVPTGTGFSILQGVATGAANVVAGTATAGNMVLSDINAGTAALNITGALSVGDTINANGLITGGVFTLNTGAGIANMGNTSVDTLNSIASANSTVTMTNNKSINLNTVTGATQTLSLIATGPNTISSSTNIAISSISLSSQNFNLTGIIGTLGSGSVNLTSTTSLANFGTLRGNFVGLSQANSMDETTLNLANVSANLLGLRVTGVGSNIGNNTGDRFLVPANFAAVTAQSDNGSVFLTTALPAASTFSIVGGSAGGADGHFDFLGTGNVAISGNVTTVDGDINIVTALNRITLVPGASLFAHGLNPGNGDIFVQVSDVSRTAKNTSIITINGTLQTDAQAAPDGLITVSVGVLTAPVAGKAPKRNVTVNLNGGTIFWGKKSSTFSLPNNTFTAKGTNIVLNNTLSNKNIVFSGATVFADPPVAAGTPIVSYVAPSTGAAAPSASTNFASPSAVSEQVVASPAHQIPYIGFGFDTDNSMVTSDLSVLNLSAQPQLQAASNASLITAERAGALNTLAAATAGRAGAMNAFASDSSAACEDDNSYVVGFCPMIARTEAAICSDAEIGIAEGTERGGASHASIQRVQHSDRVVIKKGNVLFVPFKATTVETPSGIVRIDAKSVVLVSSSDAGLAVYDLEDQHKGSVIVESNGHSVVLSPGRHVMVTKHHTAEFAQINAVETIAHRNVQSSVKNGHRAHTSEFSVLTAMDTVKPLKAMVGSKNAHAKQIADRMMKTAAIILQIGGMSGGQYQHYFKPRMTAMQR